MWKQLTLTDLLAVWGAVVSSFVAGWNIFRDVVQRDRLEVRASIMITYPERQDVFNWSIANLGRREMYVTHLVGSPVKILRPQWLLKPINRQRARRKGTRFLFPFDHMYGRLPQKVSALNNTILVYDLKKLGLPDIQELFAITADGREWFVGRAEINRILNNDEFKAARRPIPTAKSS